MFSWQKLGKIFDPTAYPDREWMQEFAQAPATLIFDDYVRVFFSCRPKPDENRQYTSNSAWVDLDRKDIRRVIRVSQKPVLNLGGLGDFDEHGIYPVSVIRDREKLLLYYGGWTRCESVPFNVAIGLAISNDDGQHFEKYGRGPILSYTLHEPFILSGPKIRQFNNQFFLFYIAGTKWVNDNGKPEPVYKIRLASSNDGLKWKKLGKNLIPDFLDDEEAQASPDVFFSNGKYHMFFCFRHGRDYRNASRGYRIGYAYSTDLVSWTRDDSLAGLYPSAEGWDSECVCYPHLFKLDNSVFMLYIGNGVGRWGFGAAELKGDLE